MATSNNRDVRLGINVETTGEAGVQQLGKDIRGLGTAAGASTPDLDRLTAELNTLTAATAAQRKAEASARVEAAAAKAERNAAADALARYRAATDTATRATIEGQAAEKALRVNLNESKIAAREKAAAVSAAAAESRAAAAAERVLADQIRAAAAASIAGARVQVEANAAVGASFEALSRQAAAVRNVVGLALGGSIAGGLIKDVSASADAYSSLSASVKIATGDSGNFAQSLQGVFDVASRTGVAVDEVGALVVKLTQAGKELGITNADALALAETVTQALKLSGATAQEAASSTQQLAQALGSGKLAWDELKAILESGPVLARALADGLGTTVGKLKDLGSTGALTAKQVVDALRGQGAAVQAQFDLLPRTVGQSVTALSNAWEKYIGAASQGSGASRAAAAAIQELATHLDSVAGFLYSAGKAAAAYSAVRLAQSFIESATAARASAAATAAATTATVAHTSATAANTAAQAGNAAATAGMVASAGRLATILGSLKLLTFVGIVTNIKEIGTALGEGVAKAAGYGKAIENLEIAQRADEQASRANAAAKAALAQSTALAADKTLGLNDAAKRLIAEFDGEIQKTNDATEALVKLSKALKLDDLAGISAAGAALDSLGVKGKLSGLQIRTALADALKGEDLAIFATNAAAAFDKSEQGARRLAAALDAVNSEALRRAGTSVQELSTGFSTAAASALNDVDALDRALLALGNRSTDAGRALAASLDKALAAAATERAVQAVIDRWKSLGEQGRLTGDALTAGLQKAQEKLDALKPGINSLSEAMKIFGLESQATLQTVADRYAAAWREIANTTTVSLADQRKAFDLYTAAAIAANRGIEPSAVSVARAILQIREAAASAGRGIEDGMRQGGAAVDALGVRVNALGERLNQVAGSLSGVTKAAGGSGSILTSNTAPGSSSFSSYDTGQAKVPTGTTFDNAAYQRALFDYQRSISGLSSIPANLVPPDPSRYYTSAPVTAPASKATPSSAGGANRVVDVNLNIGGQSVKLSGTQDSADALLRALELAKRTQ